MPLKDIQGVIWRYCTGFLFLSLISAAVFLMFIYFAEPLRCCCIQACPRTSGGRTEGTCLHTWIMFYLRFPFLIRSCIFLMDVSFFILPINSFGGICVFEVWTSLPHSLTPSPSLKMSHSLLCLLIHLKEFCFLGVQTSLSLSLSVEYPCIKRLGSSCLIPRKKRTLIRDRISVKHVGSTWSSSLKTWRSWIATEGVSRYLHPKDSLPALPHI